MKSLWAHGLYTDILRDWSRLDQSMTPGILLVASILLLAGTGSGPASSS
jgi:hypothetical protein